MHKFLALILCFATPAYAQDTATLILYRGKGYEGIVNPFVRPWAYFDDTYIGACHKGTKITRTVGPGPHVIHTQSEFPNPLSVTLAPGETLCIRCTIAPGIILLNWRLTVDDPAQCQKVIAKFREQDPETAPAPQN